MNEPKVAIVTGAASGIGWAISKELSAHGWRVVVADIDEAAAKRVCADHPELHAVQVDVTSPNSVNALIERTVSEFKRLDLMVNNAGITRIAAFEDFSADDWSAVLAVDLNGVLFGMQAAGRHMLDVGHGAIVNIASIAAERGVPGRAAYAAAKSAVVSLTRTAAVEWAARGVRVNAIGPGYVMTQLTGELVDTGKIDVDLIHAATPAGRFAKPEEIAAAVRFVGSDEASYVTGQVLYVDGGFVANYGVPSNIPSSKSKSVSGNGSR